MPTIGHVAVGMAAGRLWAGPAAAGRPVAAAMGAFAALALAPDLDMVAFAFGVPYEHPFGHRGFSHALPVAVAVAAALAVLARLRGRPAGRLFAFAAVVLASHGLLDALTDAGLGPALLWPFSEARLFAPLRLLPATERLLDRFVTARGVAITALEALVFSPLVLFALRRRPGP